jgi:predicted nucleic acid-binding protein
LLARFDIERAPHVFAETAQLARTLIRHVNEVPILAAAIQAQPDWLLTDDTSHFNREVSRRTSIRIDTPQEFLLLCGKLF